MPILQQDDSRIHVAYPLAPLRRERDSFATHKLTMRHLAMDKNQVPRRHVYLS
jgi:hypothetical protein